VVFALLAAVALLSSALPAHAEERDEAALKAATSAINKDYLGGKFAAAQRKLQKALKSCGKDQCSPPVLARLYRDLGVVYIGGLGKPNEGRDALARAVQADPSIRLERDLTTPEIKQAFRDVGGGSAITVDEEPRARQKHKSKPAAVAPAEELSHPDGLLLNWFSLSVQQDFLLHRATKPVCRGTDYTCFGVGGSEYEGALYDAAGNQAGGGFGIATTRVLLGFDRLFLGNVLAGARVGIAFGGAPAGKVSGKFLPLHLEARGAYFFGSEPFTHSGFRPYASLGLGVGEVDGHIAVDYYVDQAGYQANQKGTLDAWRKTGRTFFAPGLGTQYALGSASALTAELRLSVMVGTSGLAPALAVGYAHGL
jgi:hypothetical protein